MTNATNNAATITPAMRAADITACKTAGTYYGKVRPIFERYIVADDAATLASCAAAFYGDDEGRLPSLRATLSALAKKHSVKISVSIKKGFALKMVPIPAEPVAVEPAADTDTAADDAATLAVEVEERKVRALEALDAIKAEFGAEFIADYIAAAMLAKTA